MLIKSAPGNLAFGLGAKNGDGVCRKISMVADFLADSLRQPQLQKIAISSQKDNSTKMQANLLARVYGNCHIHFAIGSNKLNCFIVIFLVGVMKIIWPPNKKIIGSANQ